MSHYAVAVIHRENQSVDDLLAPYDEELEVPRYLTYTRQEAIDEVREKHEDMAHASDSECWEYFAQDYEGQDIDADGNFYSRYNADSKWDWYIVGGRWSKMLKLRGGGAADSARIGDVDFCQDDDLYLKCLRFWDVKISGKPAEPGEKFDLFYTVDYYRQRYLTRETFASEMSGFSTCAVITPDGEWHSAGRMGWWGVSSESFEEARDWEDHYLDRYIYSADPDWVITIVDCHI